MGQPFYHETFFTTKISDIHLLMVADRPLVRHRSETPGEETTLHLRESKVPVRYKPSRFIRPGSFAIGCVEMQAGEEIAHAEINASIPSTVTRWLRSRFSSEETMEDPTLCVYMESWPTDLFERLRLAAETDFGVNLFPEEPSEDER